LNIGEILLEDPLICFLLIPVVIGLAMLMRWLLVGQFSRKAIGCFSSGIPREHSNTVPIARLAALLSACLASHGRAA
jgi:hypothetical protein